MIIIKRKLIKLDKIVSIVWLKLQELFSINFFATEAKYT